MYTGLLPLYIYIYYWLDYHRCILQKSLQPGISGYTNCCTINTVRIGAYNINIIVLCTVPDDTISIVIPSIVDDNGIDRIECIYVFVCCSFIYLSICLFICMFVCMFVCLFICFFFCLFVYLNICLYVCLFICLFVYLFALFICLYVCLFVCFIYLFVCMFVCLFICMFVYLYLPYYLNSLKILIKYTTGIKLPSVYVWS